jgi:hypothetical protein
LELPLPARSFHLAGPISYTVVFHWFAARDGQLSGPWRPVEGRENWTGDVSWWELQILQIMRAQIDIILVHLIPKWEQQRINLFQALYRLRLKGYDVPKVAPFLDTFITWNGSSIDVSENPGRLEFASQYARFFHQYFEANTDSFAWTSLARIDDRLVLATWYTTYILANPHSMSRNHIADALAKSVPQLVPALRKGIYQISTALRDPDISFADERAILFSGLVYYAAAVHNDVYCHHVQGGYCDGNIRPPGIFMPRAGGSQYRIAWEHVLRLIGYVHRVYVESWNEYDEGSGIFAADPSTYYGPGGANRDKWSSEDNPFEYIRTTAWGMRQLHHTPELAASVIWHDIPTKLPVGREVTASVVVRNDGWSEWPRVNGIALSVNHSEKLPAVRAQMVPSATNPFVPGGFARGETVLFHLTLLTSDQRTVIPLRLSVRSHDGTQISQEREVSIAVY